MRSDWNRRATLDAAHFICSEHDDLTWEAFWRSGEEDVARYLLPHLAQFHLDPSSLHALDFGCGIGRLSAALARRFKAVTAFDISGEMLLRGRAYLSELRNITWVQGNGVDLQPLADASHDVVFSYLTLQHVPSRKLALGYIDEFCRVLRPGGLICVQFSYRRAYWLRRFYVAARARLSRLPAVWRWLMPPRWRRRRYGYEEVCAMETLMQHSLPPAQVAARARARGLTIVALETTDPLQTWLIARRLPNDARAD
ncbi:MAG: class I SAM-dependent methyltransferase [Thermoflexales bacterium]